MPKRRMSGESVLAAALVLALLPMVALVRPAPPPEERSSQPTAGGTPAPESPSPALEPAGDGAAYACTGGCEATPAQAEMHLADVRGDVHTDPYGNYLLVVYVVVHGGDHTPLGQVKVDASIWWPNGGPVNRTRITRDANGSARFHWGSIETGRWRLCVDSLTREGYLYDPDAGEAPSCAEWTN